MENGKSRSGWDVLSRWAFAGWLMFALCLGLAWAGPGTAGDDPVAFLSRFYEGYLNGNNENRRGYPQKTPLFSQGFKALLAENEHCCELMRGDDICGFGADGDMYLDTQECGPNLNFKTSEFRARLSAPGTVVASFTVWPGEKDFYWRVVQFHLVPEEGNWRVDDFGFLSASDTFRSARAEIKEENARLIVQARSLQETWSWVHIYLYDTTPEVTDRVRRFFAPSLKMIDEKGASRTIKATDKTMREIILRLQSDPALKDPDREFGTKESAHPRVGDEAVKGPLVFRFANPCWWIVKIDFRMEKPTRKP